MTQRTGLTQIPAGISVKTSHLRIPAGRFAELETLPHYTRHDLKQRGLEPGTKGGETVVRLIREVDYGRFEVVAEGWARCRPDENFSRKLGRQIALGRALKALGEAR